MVISDCAFYDKRPKKICYGDYFTLPITIPSSSTISQFTTSYTRTNHDMYSRPKSSISSRPMRDSSNKPPNSENPSTSQSRTARVSSSSETTQQESNCFSIFSRQSLKEQSQQSWSWAASSDFTQFPPFEQAHHRRSTESIRSGHGGHSCTKAVWSPRGRTSEGMAPEPTPLGGNIGSGSFFGSTRSSSGESAALEDSSWWTRLIKGARGWFDDKRG